MTGCSSFYCALSHLQRQSMIIKHCSLDTPVTLLHPGNVRFKDIRMLVANLPQKLLRFSLFSSRISVMNNTKAPTSFPGRGPQTVMGSKPLGRSRGRRWGLRNTDRGQVGGRTTNQGRSGCCYAVQSDEPSSPPLALACSWRTRLTRSPLIPRRAGLVACRVGCCWGKGTTAGGGTIAR